MELPAILSKVSAYWPVNNKDLDELITNSSAIVIQGLTCTDGRIIAWYFMLGVLVG